LHLQRRKAGNSDIITVQRFLFRQELDISTTTKAADTINKTPDIKIIPFTIRVGSSGFEAESHRSTF
jgi:hypothetical protein